jgi:lysozyme
MDKILDILLPLIKESEGCKLTAYLDSGGVQTIGYGQTGKDVCLGLHWSQANADDRLKQSATTVISQLLDASPTLNNETPERVAALADFVFNLGIGQYKKSTLKLRVDNSDWSAAMTEIRKWNHDDGKVLKGLTDRRLKESLLLAAKPVVVEYVAKQEILPPDKPWFIKWLLSVIFQQRK